MAMTSNSIIRCNNNSHLVLAKVLGNIEGSDKAAKVSRRCVHHRASHAFIVH